MTVTTRPAVGTQPTPLLVRLAVGVLAATQALIGGWALFAPAAFYAGFPAAGHAWVAMLPPYNEHLVRDVGALSLAVGVVLVAAVLTADRRLTAVALLAYAVYAVPHTLFHGLHLEGFGHADAVAQMAGFILQLLLVGGSAWLLWRDRTRSS
ncbi:MAG: hypothetical protein ABWX96_10345 [Propionibacteriaceae bacterium]